MRKFHRLMLRILEGYSDVRTFRFSDFPIFGYSDAVIKPNPSKIFDSA